MQGVSYVDLELPKNSSGPGRKVRFPATVMDLQLLDYNYDTKMSSTITR